MKLSGSILMLLMQLVAVESFQSSWISRRSHMLRLRPSGSLPAASASVTAPSSPAAPQKLDRKEKLAELRKEGGRFTVLTPFGALNPFGLYYGTVSVLLGIPWFIAMTCLQFLYFVTRGKFDTKRQLPIWISQLWGESLMRLTRMWPKITNKEILQEFYKQNRAAMIVANHNSWMDIPFLGATIGWKNYKLVSKKELGKVPILGKSIKVGGHIMVDRLDRKSGLRTLKMGINYLKVSRTSVGDGVYDLAL
ncbi:hypothetical protein MPSEU_000712400 [Mayamaea pseudoterrestris]|nr:hypothetical protein MPSEU_000712400 [Mayamaea pseudoterrestris]